MEPTSRAVADVRIERVLQVLEEQSDRRWSVAEMARVVNLSATRFSHLFRACVGLAPLKYLRLIRMQKAGELLLTTGSSIKEVAFCVGISDVSHFVRHFKKVHGVCPSDFRESMWSQNSRIGQ